VTSARPRIPAAWGVPAMLLVGGAVLVAASLLAGGFGLGLVVGSAMLAVGVWGWARRVRDRVDAG
jgi:membrane-bound ClpP family serine protease